jgi:hypothetical protein
MIPKVKRVTEKQEVDGINRSHSLHSRGLSKVYRDFRIELPVSPWCILREILSRSRLPTIQNVGGFFLEEMAPV